MPTKSKSTTKRTTQVKVSREDVKQQTNKRKRVDDCSSSSIERNNKLHKKDKEEEVVKGNKILSFDNAKKIENTTTSDGIVISKYELQKAIIPEYKPFVKGTDEKDPLLLYTPYILSNEETDSFINNARNKILSIDNSIKSISDSSVLEILHKHQYNTDSALNTIDKSTIRNVHTSLNDHIRQSWSRSQISRYSYGLREFHKKKFGKISSIVPNKTCQEVIEYYYWSKNEIKKNKSNNKTSNLVITIKSTICKY